MAKTKIYKSFAELAKDYYKKEDEKIVKEVEEEEQKARKEREAAYDARYAAAFDKTAAYCAEYNAVENALEDAFERYEEKAACYDKNHTLTFEIGKYVISITEIDEGFEIEVNGKACIVDDLVVTNGLIRYFLG